MSQAAIATGPGSYFGRYQILDCLAQSMMSHVYRVRLRFGGRDRILVLKTLHPRLMDDVKTREYFFREIQTCMTLGHANIVQIHDFGEEQGSPFIVMEWVHGRNLKRVVEAELERSKRGLPVPLAVHFAEQTARGLHHAHTLKDKVTGEPVNVIHRDLSPHNVLVSFDGSVKVIDFGLARPVKRETDTLSEQVWGKPGYMSPEQVLAGHLDRRSDLFSLGTVFWEMLSGHKLFQGDNSIACAEKILSSDTYVPRMLGRMPGLPEPLAKVIAKCLRVNRDQRYASAEEIARDLQSYMRTLPQPIEQATAAHFMGKLFADEIDEERARLREYSSAVAPPGGTKEPTDTDTESGPGLSLGELDESEEVPELAETQSHPIPITRKPAPALRPEPKPEPEPERISLEQTRQSTREETEIRVQQSGLERVPEFPVSPEQDSLPPVKGIVAAIIIALALAAGWHFSGAPPPSTTADVALQISPGIDPYTELFLDGNPIALQGESIPSVALGKTHRLEIRRAHYLPLVHDFIFERCEPSCVLQLKLAPFRKPSS